MELAGARAIVTGGAGGIGQSCVAQLRAHGSRVAVLDIARPAGDDAFSVDVSDEGSVVDGVAQATNALGGLDIAIISAGVGGGSPLLDLTTAEWDRVMNVNLRGAFVSLRECAACHDGRRRDRRDHEHLGFPR